MATITPDFYIADGSTLPSPIVASNGTLEVDRSRIKGTGLNPFGPTFVGSFDSTYSNHHITASVKFGASVSGASGIIVRYTDNDNLFFVNLGASTGGCAFVRRQSGVNTVLGSYDNPDFFATRVFLVECISIGSDYHIYINGIYRQSFSDTFNSTETGVAFRIGAKEEHQIGYYSVTDTTIKLRTPSYYCQQQVSGSATFDIEGYAINVTGNIEYSTDGGASYQTGVVSPSDGLFTFSVTLSVGQHDLIIRDSSNTSITDEIKYVTVGDGIVLVGQSNAGGRGYNYQQSTSNQSGIKPIMLSNANCFKPLSDPINTDDASVYEIIDDPNARGNWILNFAHKYQNATNVPLFIIPCAQGSTSIDEWQKTNTDRIGGFNRYETISPRLALTNGAKRLIFLQGETDAGASTTRTQYETDLGQFIDDINTDFGLDTFIVPLIPIEIFAYEGNGGAGATDTGQAAIRQAQINVAAANANAEIGQEVVSHFDLKQGDRIHYIDDDQLELLADLMFETYSQLYLDVTLNLSVTNIPDGTYTVNLFEEGFNSLVFSGDATFTSESASVTIQRAATSREINGFIIDGSGVCVIDVVSS